VRYLLIALLLSAAGCSGGKHTGAVTGSPGATAAAASPSARATAAAPGSRATPASAVPLRSARAGATHPPGSQNVTVSETDNGHTISVRRQDVVTAVLHSTYWTFNKPSDQRVLLAMSDPTASPQTRGCVPGQGCGTVTVRYLAVGVGRSVISAHRDTCGEALKCSPAQSDWRVTVVVTGS